MKPLVVGMVLMLNGCAACRQHPAACAVVTTIAAGAVIYSIDRSSTKQPSNWPAFCAGGACR